MSIPSPPQGIKKGVQIEFVLAETLNQAYTTPDDVFPAPVPPQNLSPGEQVNITINFATDANNAVLSYTLDGTTYVNLGNVEKDINHIFIVPVKEGDPLQLRLDKTGTILYCRIGQME